MKEALKKFTCDNFGCLKTITIKEAVEGFPYDKGWRYIYNLEGKTDEDKTLIARDKHFCSEKCLKNFMTVLFYETKTKPKEFNKKTVKSFFKEG